MADDAAAAEPSACGCMATSGDVMTTGLEMVVTIGNDSGTAVRVVATGATGALEAAAEADEACGLRFLRPEAELAAAELDATGAAAVTTGVDAITTGWTTGMGTEMGTIAGATIATGAAADDAEAAAASALRLRRPATPNATGRPTGLAPKIGASTSGETA